MSFLALMENALHFVQLNRSYPIWVLVWAFFLHFYVLTGRCPGKYLGWWWWGNGAWTQFHFLFFSLVSEQTKLYQKGRYVDMLNCYSRLSSTQQKSWTDLTIIMTMILSVWRKRASSPISAYIRSYHIYHIRYYIPYTIYTIYHILYTIYHIPYTIYHIYHIRYTIYYIPMTNIMTMHRWHSVSGESEQVLLFLSWRSAEQEAPCTIGETTIATLMMLGIIMVKVQLAFPCTIGETIIATLTTNVIDNVDDDADVGHVDDRPSRKSHAPSIGEMMMWSPMHYFVFLSL